MRMQAIVRRRSPRPTRMVSTLRPTRERYGAANRRTPARGPPSVKSLVREARIPDAIS
jgi:hypothetical protein